MKIIPAAVTAAICGLALFTAVRPATALTGLGAVACVGSGPAAEAGANPVRDEHPADREVAYRIGVPLDDREAVARGLRAQLDGYAEVLCAWSGPGDSHLVIIGYTRANRQDPTLRARGGEFEAFAVGYGSSWGLGNVWEWTENCWKRNYGGLSAGERYRLHSPNHLGFVPTGMLRDCSRGVLRGGSWHSDFGTIRSASRNSLWGGIRLDYNGFRVARSIS